MPYYNDLNISAKPTEPSVKMIDENTFTTEVEGTTAYFGVHNNLFYFTNDEKVYNNIKSGKKKENDASKIAKDNLMAISGDLHILKSLVNIIAEESYPDETAMTIANDVIDMFVGYEFVANDGYTGKGKIEMKDKKKNSLAQICSYVDKLITDYLPASFF